MAYIENGGPAGTAGIFYRIAFQVEEVQHVVQTLNLRLPNHWPFIGIKVFLGDIGDRPTGVNKALAWLIALLWKADTWAKPLVNDIADRLRTGDLDGLIETYAPGVWKFFDDPWDAIKGYLKDERPKGWALIDDPFGKIDDWLKDNQPKLWDFKEDPKQYILDRLKDAWPDGYDFLTDPVGELDEWLEDEYPALWAFKKDPKQYVLDRLKEIDEELYNFALDPLDWVLTEIGEAAGLPAKWWLDWPDCVVDLAVDKAEGYHERHKDRIYYLGEHILRYMIEGVW